MPRHGNTSLWRFLKAVQRSGIAGCATDGGLDAARFTKDGILFALRKPLDYCRCLCRTFDVCKGIVHHVPGFDRSIEQGVDVAQGKVDGGVFVVRDKPLFEIDTSF